MSVSGVAKIYGSGAHRYEAIRNVSFESRQGEFVCIVGPSGCGKTTLLRCISGLMSTTGGYVKIHGRTVSAPPPQIGVVFQEYTRSLFPWMTVSKNVEQPLKKRQGRKERANNVAAALDAVALGHAKNMYPWQLSGGMQQRVAIARAIAYRPEILVMDEPFASVDAQTRFALEDLIMALQQSLAITVVFVTHDIDEAVYLADRVLVLSQPPCVVTEDISVNLPRPRDQINTKALDDYHKLRTRVFEEIIGD